MTWLRTTGLLGILIGVWLARPVMVDDASSQTNVPVQDPHAALSAGSVAATRQRGVPAAPDLRQALAQARYRQQQRLLAQQRRLLAHEAHQAMLDALHQNLSLHAVGSQLYTSWGAPMTLKTINWYGFEYAPFVPGGLDKTSLDSILATVHQLGFNALRITFADETVESNPVVSAGLAANPQLRSLHALDVMQRIIERAHDFGLRVILCNSRSEAGRGPELKTGLWYTAAYPQTAWASDWITLIRRFRNDSAFVGADLRNEPHLVGSTLDRSAILKNGPLWGAFQGTYYHDLDWRYAAETLGNQMLAINPNMLIIVEGVQMYLDPLKGVLTGGLWGSNLIGVQYDPIVLSRPGQLVYSVHEYGPHMWQGDWFNPKTTYASLASRWDSLWGYLLRARKVLRAPILVGEFGTCHNYYACIASDQGWKQGFWFQSFVRYLAAHPSVGWAYWALNPDGPFRAEDDDFYSLTTRDWRHYYPLLTYGLALLLREPGGIWSVKADSLKGRAAVAMTPQPGCLPGKSCTSQALAQLGVTSNSPNAKGANRVPIAPLPGNLFPVSVRVNLPYIQPADPTRVGDLYLPQKQPAGTRPAVVILHGTSWSDGQKGQPGTVALAEGLAQHGYVAFDINYRLAGAGGNFPSDVQDVKDAVGFLAANHARFRVDVRRLAVVGSGSGGHLALLTAYTPNAGIFASPHYGSTMARIGVVASFFGPSDLAKLAQRAPDPAEAAAIAEYMGVPYAKNPQAYVQASPITHVSTAVSTILFHGIADRRVPIWQPFDLYRLLRQSKAPSELVDLPGAPHSLMDLSPQQRGTALNQIVAFFDNVFYKPPPAS
ncbi:MAG TPA: cellulase family glycosylhydrolase [Chloroflexota bacterium]